MSGGKSFWQNRKMKVRNPVTHQTFSLKISAIVFPQLGPVNNPSPSAILPSCSPTSNTKPLLRFCPRKQDHPSTQVAKCWMPSCTFSPLDVRGDSYLENTVIGTRSILDSNVGASQVSLIAWWKSFKNNRSFEWMWYTSIRPWSERTKVPAGHAKKGASIPRKIERRTHNKDPLDCARHASSRLFLTKSWKQSWCSGRQKPAPRNKAQAKH